MSKDVVMPALGMAQETGRIVRWLVPEGSDVRRGDALLEIETDKVTVEVEAPGDGVLAAVAAGEGADVPVGQVIARILGPGEVPEEAEPESAESGVADRYAEGRVGTTAGAVTAGAVTAGAPPTSPVQRRRARLSAASPKARRLAEETGLEVGSVVGTGPGGAVLEADVRATRPAARERVAPAEAAELVELPAAWSLMATRTTQSWTSAPHFYLTREIAAARLLTWLERIRARSGADVTVTDVILRVVAASLREHPRMNASWTGEGVSAGGPVNLGLAVATDEGLVVPILHDAEALTVEEVAGRRRDLVDRARTGALRPEDVQGGTFTVTNLGMFGVDSFAAVINPPQAAILAVGRIAERPVVEEGRVVAEPRMTMTLSCDHRVVDGARAARFLGTLAEHLEEPLGLFG